VKHDFDVFAGTSALLRVGEITLNELHCFESGEVAALAGNKIVDASNVFTALQQCRSDRAAYESGSSCDKIFRQPSLPTCGQVSLK
jgi:hypothetical protein